MHYTKSSLQAAFSGLLALLQGLPLVLPRNISFCA